MHLIGIGIALGFVLGHFVTKHWPTISKLLTERTMVDDDSE